MFLSWSTCLLFFPPINKKPPTFPFDFYNGLVFGLSPRYFVADSAAAPGGILFLLSDLFLWSVLSSGSDLFFLGLVGTLFSPSHLPVGWF